jgi:5-methylcytosine-specific restriction endonuclease McrA
MKTHKCQYCGGTIGVIDHIVSEFPMVSNKGMGIFKITEVWFNCIHCEAELGKYKTLVDIVL